MKQDTPLNGKFGSIVDIDEGVYTIAMFKSHWLDLKKEHEKLNRPKRLQQYENQEWHVCVPRERLTSRPDMVEEVVSNDFTKQCTSNFNMNFKKMFR